MQKRVQRPRGTASWAAPSGIEADQAGREKGGLQGVEKEEHGKKSGAKRSQK
jgi:hypothetical protein